VAGLIAFAPPVAAAANPISVRGSGVRGGIPGDPTPFNFAFDARTTPNADGDYGTFSGSFPHDPYFRNGDSAPGNFATFSGTMTCLQVNDSTATIGGVISSGFGYDGDPSTPDLFSQNQRDLNGDWFITTAQDPKGDTARDTIGYVDWGDRAYFLNAGYGYTSFDSVCDHPSADLGTTQFPLVSGDLSIRH
jgi:hypothetical protein